MDFDWIWVYLCKSRILHFKNDTISKTNYNYGTKVKNDQLIIIFGWQIRQGTGRSFPDTPSRGSPTSSARTTSWPPPQTTTTPTTSRTTRRRPGPPSWTPPSHSQKIKLINLKSVHTIPPILTLKTNFFFKIKFTIFTFC